MSALDEFLDEIGETAQSAGPSVFEVATVVTVTAGTPPTVTVDWKGAVVPARCPKRWTTSDIAVGDVVVMTRPPQLLILHAY